MKDDPENNDKGIQRKTIIKQNITLKSTERARKGKKNDSPLGEEGLRRRGARAGLFLQGKERER